MRFRRNYKALRSHFSTYLMAFIAVLITIEMVQYPKDAFDSAIAGLNLWWNVVFPALLPFFILSELLMGLGVVHFVGILLEPLMRPLFNVPGVGAFALSMGLASGYPMDAVITCKFRKNQLCSAVEAERLLSFTNTADPLFMFGAVAVGMFGMPELGSVIAVSHYLSSFLVGLLFRYHGKERDNYTKEPSKSFKYIIIQAFKALYKAKMEDKRSIGQLLGDSVKSSMHTILLIGGFIILFSVFIRILTVIGITEILNHFFSVFLTFISFSTNLSPALVNGLFEIDLGALSASQSSTPLIEKTVIASAIIAWSGLSVHGQVASIVIESGIRMAPYMVARLIHAFLAGLLTYFFMSTSNSQDSLYNYYLEPAMVNMASSNTILSYVTRIEQTGFFIILLLFILVTLSLCIQIIKDLYAYKYK